MQPKKVIISLEERKKAFVRSLEDLELKNRLLGSPTLFNPEIGSDEYLDVLSIKIKLNGGQEFTIEEYLSDVLVDYISHFYPGYYDVIAKLYGLPPEVMKNYIKPLCARDFTLQFVYARFPKRVIDFIMGKSKWSKIPGIRLTKLFQRLSPVATVNLDLFIEQCEAMGNDCADITEFKQKYSSKYRVYFQIDMFIDININP